MTRQSRKTVGKKLKRVTEKLQGSLEELTGNLLLCDASEMIDRLGVYSEIGIDAVISTSNFGQDQAWTLDMMSRFSQEVMPHLQKSKARAAE